MKYNWDTVILPSNMTSVIKPVDPAIFRSFKSKFRRLLVAHILEFAEKRMDFTVYKSSTFKLAEALTNYGEVVMMKRT